MTSEVMKLYFPLPIFPQRLLNKISDVVVPVIFFYINSLNDVVHKEYIFPALTPKQYYVDDKQGKKLY